MELHADRLPKAWGNRTAAFTHFFGQMEKQQYRVANTEINYQKVGWYQQYKTVCHAANELSLCPCAHPTSEGAWCALHTDRKQTTSVMSVQPHPGLHLGIRLKSNPVAVPDPAPSLSPTLVYVPC